MKRCRELQIVQASTDDASGSCTLVLRGEYPWTIQIDITSGDVDLDVTGKLHPLAEPVALMEVPAPLVGLAVPYLQSENFPLYSLTVTWTNNTGDLVVYAAVGEVDDAG